MWFLFSINTLSVCFKGRARGELHFIKTIQCAELMWCFIFITSRCWNTTKPRISLNAFDSRKHCSETDSLLTPNTDGSRLSNINCVCNQVSGLCGFIRHSFTWICKSWGCRVAKSWGRAEVVQHSASLLWRCKLLPLNIHVIYFFHTMAGAQ